MARNLVQDQLSVEQRELAAQLYTASRTWAVAQYGGRLLVSPHAEVVWISPHLMGQYAVGLPIMTYYGEPFAMVPRQWLPLIFSWYPGLDAFFLSQEYAAVASYDDVAREICATQWVRASRLVFQSTDQERVPHSERVDQSQFGQPVEDSQSFEQNGIHDFRQISYRSVPGAEYPPRRKTPTQKRRERLKRKKERRRRYLAKLKTVSRRYDEPERDQNPPPGPAGAPTQDPTTDAGAIRTRSRAQEHRVMVVWTLARETAEVERVIDAEGETRRSGDADTLVIQRDHRDWERQQMPQGHQTEEVRVSQAQVVVEEHPETQSHTEWAPTSTPTDIWRGPPPCCGSGLPCCPRQRRALEQGGRTHRTNESQPGERTTNPTEIMHNREGAQRGREITEV